MLYLNLDLLENVKKYLFPLFYYEYTCVFNGKEIYCSITKKSVYFDNHNKNVINYYDYQNNFKKTINNIYICIQQKPYTKFTENNIFINKIPNALKTKPFKISQKHLNYLRNSKRLK